MRDDFSTLADNNRTATGTDCSLPGKSSFNLSFLDVESVKHDPIFPGKHEVECLSILCDLYGESQTVEQRYYQLRQIKEIVNTDIFSGLFA